MDRATKQTLIRTIAKQNQGDPEGSFILWSRHATVELVNESWQRQAVESALAGCEVIEDYPTLHRPLPDCLVLGIIQGEIPMHAVIAIDEKAGKLFVITVYRPKIEEWQNDWRTRR